MVAAVVVVVKMVVAVATVVVVVKLVAVVAAVVVVVKVVAAVVVMVKMVAAVAAVVVMVGKNGHRWHMASDTHKKGYDCVGTSVLQECVEIEFLARP